MNISSNDINKYFSFNGRCGFYKIVRFTAKTVFFKSCIMDKYLHLNNGILWINYNSIHYYHYIEETKGDEIKVLIKKFSNFTFHENITNLYYRDYEIKDGYNDSYFYLDSEVLKTASSIKYNLLSTTSAEDKIDRDERAPGILKILLIKLKKEFKKPNIEHLLTIMKNEIFGYHYRDHQIIRINTIIEKYNLMEFVKILTLHENVDCPVCLNTKDTHSGHYECSHLICGECFESWNKINKTCPLCRSE